MTGRSLVYSPGRWITAVQYNILHTLETGKYWSFIVTYLILLNIIIHVIGFRYFEISSLNGKNTRVSSDQSRYTESSCLLSFYEFKKIYTFLLPIWHRRVLCNGSIIIYTYMYKVIRISSITQIFQFNKMYLFEF